MLSAWLQRRGALMQAVNYRADSSAWPCLPVSLLNLHSQHGVGSAASLPVVPGLQICRQNSGPAEVTRGWDLKADSVSPPVAGRSWRLVKHFLYWVNARRWLRCCLQWQGPAEQPSPPSCSMCPSPSTNFMQSRYNLRSRPGCTVAVTLAVAKPRTGDV